MTLLLQEVYETFFDSNEETWVSFGQYVKEGSGDLVNLWFVYSDSFDWEFSGQQYTYDNKKEAQEKAISLGKWHGIHSVKFDE